MGQIGSTCLSDLSPTGDKHDDRQAYSQALE